MKEYFENLPILAYKVTIDGKIADCNNVVIRTLGLAHAAVETVALILEKQNFSPRRP